MKKFNRSITYAVVFMMMFFIVNASWAQRDLMYYRPDNSLGLNVFETTKDTDYVFDGLQVKVGGDFALQFQGLSQENSLGNLVELGSNLNLPTANLNLDVQLEDGLRMHLRTYLSAKHHQEAWVKGGYLQMDKLDFVSDGFLEGIMQYTTIKVGMDEINYGDAHFRRTDNARAIFNPFVGNYIMDAFSTEAFAEVFVQNNGLLALVAISNGKLNQSVVVNDNTDNKLSFYGKLGYDDYVSEDFRLRLTGSWYINHGTSTGSYIYGGDRAGGRYYNVMQTLDGDGSDFEGRFNPRFSELTALQFNPFLKYKGLEFFGIYEVAMNGEDQGNGQFTQLAAELLYRFGEDERFYLGGRYNQVKGEQTEDAATLTIDRFNIGGGWFMTKNIVAKIEYVKQNYDGYPTESKYNGGEFSGLNIEAAISF
ncbi:hypothetical protein [Echinicola sp. 20G]|uniref:hypothetical protein n=1 Tax=Echinicola sp. 20G TaxID=2781961 RepID=UPI001910CCA4|nr:hypothetical protein [Echinicola sp. 20G]